MQVADSNGEYIELDGISESFGCRGADWAPFRYSGSSPVPSELVVVVDATGRGGCDASDYTPAANPWAAVTTDDPTCNVYAKALAAQQAGASALIVHRTMLSATPVGGRVRDSDWTDNSTTITIPAVGATAATGQ